MTILVKDFLLYISSFSFGFLVFFFFFFGSFTLGRKGGRRKLTMVLTYPFFLKQIGYKVCFKLGTKFLSLYDLKKEYYIGFVVAVNKKGKFVYLLPRAYRLKIRQKLDFEKSHELSPPSSN